MRKLAIVSVGIITIAGAAAAVALREDNRASADNNPQTQHNAEPAENESGVNVELDSSSTSTNGSTSSSTRLNVNGEDIEVPENGAVHKRIESNGQVTDINVQSSSSQNGASNSNSTEVEVNISD